MVASTLFSEAKKGVKLLRNPAFLGIPKQVDKNRNGCLTRAFSGGAQKTAELLRSRCVLNGSQRRGQNQKFLPHLCLLGGAKRGHEWYGTPALSRMPEQGEKIRNGCLTPAFSGAKKRVKLLRNPAFLGIPKQGDKIRSGCLTPTFSVGTKESGIAM